MQVLAKFTAACPTRLQATPLIPNSTVVPEASTNLVINPSFEIVAMAEYEAGGDWFDFTNEEFPAVGATAGRCCARISVGQGSMWLQHNGPLSVTPGHYTFSLDVNVEHVPLVLKLEVRYDTAVYAQKTFTITRGGWQRIHLTYNEQFTGPRELRLTATGTLVTQTDIYTDAWQFEAKAYPTTYLDGDMIGFTDVRRNQSYNWTGAPHQSTSVRRETTGSGGRVVSWSEEVAFATTSIVGLGMTTVEPRTMVLADGSEIHRGAAIRPREFTIAGRIFGKDYRHLIHRHNDLMALVKANNTVDHQQFILRYQQVDDAKQLVGRPLDIVCTYIGGLQGNVTNFYQENIALQFRASQPFPSEVFESSAEIILKKHLEDNGIIFRDEDGDYINLGTGATTGVIHDVGFYLDGSPIAIGGFTQIAGDSATNAARWNGTAWEQFGTTTGDLRYLHDGHEMGYEPVAAIDDFDGGFVALYNPDTDTWDQLGNAFTGSIRTLDRDTNGDIWVGGNFATDEAAIEYNNFAMYDVSAGQWIALGSGLEDPDGGVDTYANTVLVGDDGYVYVGGNFQTATSTVSIKGTVRNAVRWNIAETDYEYMGSGFDAPPQQFVRGSDGYIYAVGPFTESGTFLWDLRGFARWNEHEWEEVFVLERVDGTYGADGVTVDENGIFWFYNYGTTDDDKFLVPGLGPLGTFGWKDGVFYPGFPSVFVAYQAIGQGNRAIYSVTNATALDYVVVPALNEIEYEGTADAPFAFMADGSLYPIQVINLSTKGGVYFRGDFELGPTEHMVLRTDTQRVLMYSNARANLFNMLSAGASNMKALRLRPGTNRISVLATNLGDDAAAWISWRTRHQGIDGPSE
jgi:hypothetical protein